jgi:uncharacterized membrane protein
MPFVSIIIARLLALQDWYLGQFVDVSTVVNASANNCWSLNIVNATVNPCGQELGGGVFGGWGSLMGIVNMIPTLASTLIMGITPYANWTPYIPPTPPTPP